MGRNVQTIIIAGAGLGGLAAAASLITAGYDVAVYEQAPVLGEVGAGIQMSANAMHVLSALGLSEAIAAITVRPAAYVFRLHDTGEEISRFSLAEKHERLHGNSYNQLHRADLHQILVDCVRRLKPDAITVNKKAAGYEEDATGVTLRFTDGTSARADMLIGADGVKSAIRNQLVGPDQPSYTGDAAWRLTVPTPNLPAGFMDPVMSVWMGPGAHVVMYYLRAGGLLNFVGLVETDEVAEESWTAKFPWEKLKADFAGWHPDIQTVIDTAERDQCFRWSLFRRPVAPNWCTSRVTMLGDAAHATLPYLAQGAAMAIEDGAVLTRALSLRADPAEALQLYQRNRIDRCRRIVDGSTANRGLFHCSDQTEIRAAFANRDEGANRDGWLYSYNPLTVELV